jgi:hypothetical protein
VLAGYCLLSNRSQTIGHPTRLFNEKELTNQLEQRDQLLSEQKQLKVLPIPSIHAKPAFWSRVLLTDHFGLNLYSIWIACRCVDVISVVNVTGGLLFTLLDGYSDAGTLPVVGSHSGINL